jgi:transcriptional regulator with XRE-family HTH domain
MTMRKPMSDRELLRKIERMGISQQELARKLELDPRTVRRYVSGERPIPRPVEYAVRWLAELAEEAA